MIRLSRLQIFWDLIRLILFGTSIPFKSIFLWGGFGLFCRVKYIFRPYVEDGVDHRAMVKAFRHEGLVYLSSLSESEVEMLDEVNRVTQTKFGPANDSYQTLPLEVQGSEVVDNFIWTFLDSRRGELESLMGSYFQTYWITAYKTVSDICEDRGGSFLWHYDEDPRELKKIFIYLNDTSSQNGAFRYFGRKFSAHLVRRRGFISNTESRRAHAHKLVTTKDLKHVKVADGEKGAAFVFDNNIIHKGTMPLNGERKVFSIEIFPSSKPLCRENVRASLNLPITDDFPEAPWHNKYNL